MNKISIIHYYYSYLNGKSILFSFSSVNSLFSNIEYITSLSLSFIFILYYSVMSIDRVNHVCLNKIEILISYKFIYRYSIYTEFSNNGHSIKFYSINSIFIILPCIIIYIHGYIVRAVVCCIWIWYFGGPFIYEDHVLLFFNRSCWSNWTIEGVYGLCNWNRVGDAFIQFIIIIIYIFITYIYSI